jgi:hypothetical protein
MSNTTYEIKLTEIREEIVKFNNDSTAQRLKRYYYEKTYPEILGVSRRELSHSSFIAWMMDPKSSHGIGDFGIRRFLEILMTSKFWQVQENRSKFFDDLITGNFELQKSSIRREVDLEKNGRLDLLIELHISINNEKSYLRLIIENKVLSTEGKDQTNRYYDHFLNLKDEYENIFVYLTPLSSLDLDDLVQPECENKHYIQINYQSLVDALLEPAIDQTIDATTKLIISQYIQSLSQPSMEEEENDFERGMIMAIGKEERELLQKFWVNNQKIIQAALYAISSDPNQDKDVRDTVRDALASIATTGKDRSSVTIQYKGINQGTFKKSDIGSETVKLLKSKGRINNKVFKFLADDKSCSFHLLKTADQMTDNEKKYCRYRYKNEPELIHQGVDYYVARNWGIGNIDVFIKKLQDRFPELRYVIETKGLSD